MPVRIIWLLGDQVLRVACEPVSDFGTDSLKRLVQDLQDTLSDFRAKKGFGRGIAAPQIGETSRVVCIRTDRALDLINPVIVRRSRRQIILWDDCFSFPDLLVKVKRSYAIEVRYRDVLGKQRRLKATGALSELLQHEIDHTNGILAIDRAIDSRHIVLRSEFDKMRVGGRIQL
jgi:peptide deformylase